ncbi:MAG: hypothetical protein IPL58_00440 [Betaproteobacteria bacterium]|uniref:Nucleotidyltransferase-like domain-containing protein n=1 Tax=Candidatus Proximibacter danicus TaxID=2954365 RepID=A0A9D7K110_9PROT|nr:hypothetical protein [Candidatus Proximibacter danicus]
MKFNDESLRVAANLRQFYDAWIESARELDTCDVRLFWKAVNGAEYLVSRNRHGSERSLGRRAAATEQQFDDYAQRKLRLTEQEEARALRLQETCRLYIALRLGAIASEAAAILRAADRRGLLDNCLRVVGTNALAAYELEAASRFAIGMDSTEDFDLAWSADKKTALALAAQSPVSIFGMLKAIDSTYTINSERPFQARNAKAYEVELLVAPSRVAALPGSIGLAPIPLPEQEWLLEGRPVDQVVCGRNGTPARIVAPDPRWFALHKLWMSDQDKRNPLKRPKDKRQGEALLSAITAEMPHYPLDEAFRATLPPELVPYFDAWRGAQVGLTTPRLF